MIKALFEKEQRYWKKENIDLFGLDVINQYDLVEDIQNKLKESCKKYWNVKNPCLLAKNLINGKLDKDYELRVENTFYLEFNILNTCVDVYQDYVKQEKVKRYKVACIPSVTDELSWLMGNIHYIPRVTALKNNRDFVTRLYPEKVYGENWIYHIEEDKFEFYQSDLDEEKAFKQLSNRSIKVLKLVEENPTLENFRMTLRQLPIIDASSVFNYIFSRMEYFKNIILNTTKFAKPTSKTLLGVNQILLSQRKQETSNDEDFEGSLTSSKNKIFSLENFRTTVNIYNGTFKPTFSYVDTTGLFDSFKTVTTGQAGRQRLLLDNIIVKEGMLYIQDGNEEKDMYQYFFEPQKARLSCLSESPFCNNDKPKRIMMNAKLTAQSCPLEDEIDNLTHRILARVGFADIEGYSYGDSIIISESFAKKLKTKEKEIITIEKERFSEEINLETLRRYFPTKHPAFFEGWENIRITRIEDLDPYVRFVIEYDIPFRLGDKITNLHGAKGTVGLILPDDEMPRLENKVGNMEKGPLEVIISGFSTMRRGSLGQIFEAWATASGIEGDFIAKVIHEHKDQMKTYSENSKVTFRNETTTMPIGLNRIMRINQHTFAKISTSTRNSRKKLKLGEMERLNLMSNDCPHILRELGYRDLEKYVGGYHIFNKLEAIGELPEHSQLVLRTGTLFKSLGYNIKVNGKEVDKSNYNFLDLFFEDLLEEEE